MYMYADDTTLFCCLEDLNSVNREQVVNSELKSVHLCLSKNRLTLNANKSKYMLFCNRKNTQLPKLNLLKKTMATSSLALSSIFMVSI